MTGAHGNAQLVEQHAHIVVVDAIDEERNHAAFLPGSAEDAHTGDLHQSLGGDGEQPVLVGGDVVESESFHIVDGSAKGGNIYIIGRSCLKLKRQFGVGGAFPRHMTNHFASALVGIHALKQRFLAVEHTHAGGTVHLVRREHIEVGIEVTHVDFQVRGSLCAIYEHGNAVAVGNGYHLLHRIYGAEHIRHVAHRHEAGILRQQILKCLHLYLSAAVHRHHAQIDALVALNELPRHNVGVMLHCRHYNLVAVAQRVAKR